jgi:hypothetical protein
MGAGAGGVTFFSLNIASAAPKSGAVAADFGAGAADGAGAGAATEIGAGTAAGLGAVAGVGAGAAEDAGATAGAATGALAGGISGLDDEGITTDGADMSIIGVEAMGAGADGTVAGAPVPEGCPIDALIFDITCSFTSLAMLAACSALTFKLSVMYGAKSCGSVRPRISCPVSASNRPVWSICREYFAAMSLIMPPISLL